MTGYPTDWLTDRVAVVTGGGTGIGRAIAEALAGCGATVVVAGRRPEPLDETVAAISAAGGRASAVPTNIRDAEQVDALVAAVLDAHGRVDVLVNNAGGQFLARALDISPNGWRSVIDLNLTGTFLCTRAVARHMVDHGGGSIVSITASSMVEVSAAGRAHSGAARAGVKNLTRTLAVELGPAGVRVNAVGVGVVVTEGMEHEFRDDVVEASIEGTPQRRICTPEDVANTVLFLASDVSSHVTGEWINVDGGMRLVESVDWLGAADG